MLHDDAISLNLVRRIEAALHMSMPHPAPFNNGHTAVAVFVTRLPVQLSRPLAVNVSMTAQQSLLAI